MTNEIKELLEGLKNTCATAIFNDIELGKEFNLFNEKYPDAKLIAKGDEYIYEHKNMHVRRYNCDEWDIVLALDILVSDELYLDDVVSVLGEYEQEYTNNKNVTMYIYGDRCSDKGMVIFNANEDSKIEKIDVASTIFMD